MTEPFRPGTAARASADYETMYSDPLTVSAGEELTLGRRDDEWPGWIWCVNRAGKGGWAPERYVEERGEGSGVARQDYTAAELPLRAGDTLTLHAEESGWYWATNAAGRSGWVPRTHIVLEDAIDR
jgi:SH3 domain/Variant SH3 domain